MWIKVYLVDLNLFIKFIIRVLCSSAEKWTEDKIQEYISCVFPRYKIGIYSWQFSYREWRAHNWTKVGYTHWCEKNTIKCAVLRTNWNLDRAGRIFSRGCYTRGRQEDTTCRRCARSTFDIGIDIRSYCAIKIAFDFSREVCIPVVRGYADFAEGLFRRSMISSRKIPLWNCSRKIHYGYGQFSSKLALAVQVWPLSCTQRIPTSAFMALRK